MDSTDFKVLKIKTRNNPTADQGKGSRFVHCGREPCWIKYSEFVDKSHSSRHRLGSKQRGPYLLDPSPVDSKISVPDARRRTHMDHTFPNVENEIHVIDKAEDAAPGLHVYIGIRLFDDRGAGKVPQDRFETLPGFVGRPRESQGFDLMNFVRGQARNTVRTRRARFYFV